MMQYITDILDLFRPCFSRLAPFRWFCVSVLGFLCRLDALGVTSFLRALGLPGKAYEPLLHSFRSDATSSAAVRARWREVAAERGDLVRVGGRAVLAGDGTKVAKEGRRIPANKRLFQESEDSSKPSYIHGHMLGAVGVLASNGRKTFCIPLEVTVQDGLSATALWEGGDPERAESHVVRVVRSAHRCAVSLAGAVCALDRYFLSVPALQVLDELNGEVPEGGRAALALVARCKSNCVAWEPPPERKPGTRGRPRKKGPSVRVWDLFDDAAADFEETGVVVYGKTERARVLCRDLRWGKGLYRPVRFVLVERGDGSRAAFACTDPSMPPEEIVAAYGMRFQIECTFREMKQQVGAFCYRFWTLACPRLDRYRKKGGPDPLESVTDPAGRKRVLGAVEACERFVACACVATGLAQAIALDPGLSGEVERARWLRTSTPGKVSEATVMEYLRRNVFRLLLQNRSSWLCRFILEAQAGVEGGLGADLAA